MKQTAERSVTPDQWRAERRWYQEHRHELAPVAGRLYPEHARVDATWLLCRDSWLPEHSLDLADVRLTWNDEIVPLEVDGRGPDAKGVRTAGATYASYGDAMQAIARPSVFENRWTYRLLDADLTGDAPQLAFCRGRYFDSVDVGEAAGHELGVAVRGRSGGVGLGDVPFRAALGDPCAVGRRPASLALSTLTVRHDRRRRQATFLLHRRDPAKVTHAGGLHQVLPVGVFQPALDSVESERADFDLWKSIVREYAEELLGESEHHDRPIDYEAWDVYRDLTDARASGLVKVSCLGLGVDPVTLAVDLLTVAVFDADVYDRLFAGLVDINDEGDLCAAIPFERRDLDPYLARELPIQPAGQAALALAWEHRETLL